MDGILYVVATPIGNLKDITLRAVEVLGSADFVVAEDRSRALKLLSHLGIRKPIIGINSYSEERKAVEISLRLREGASAALITAAGTPCISDPGRSVVRRCIDEGLEVKAVPGPSAAIGALSISGLYADRFLFYGFLPLKKGKRKKVLREMAQFPYAMVFFESPRRLKGTLEAAYEELGDREATVIKEMTKIHEETWKGALKDLIREFESPDVKGEYVLVVSGVSRERREDPEEDHR
jgi:16S rRNA (cytidine1402-2'-O)-methyltransferase